MANRANRSPPVSLVDKCVSAVVWQGVLNPKKSRKVLKDLAHNRGTIRGGGRGDSEARPLRKQREGLADFHLENSPWGGRLSL